jgi:hypothetical protein
MRENIKYCVCLWGELRAVKSTVASFFKNLVEPLDADVMIVCQKALHDDVERIQLILDNCGLDRVTHNELYDKPNLSDFYGHDAYKCAKALSANNWLIDSNAHHYVNFKKYADIIAEGKFKYERYIFIRTDFMHVVTFPDVTMFETSEDGAHAAGFWCYHGHSYGGINYTMMVVPNTHVMDYLTLPFMYISDPAKSEVFHKRANMDWNLLNCEVFMRCIFEDMGWKLAFIKHTAFLTAESMADRTTWARIMHHPGRRVFYKYSFQLDEAYQSLDSHDKGGKWQTQTLVDPILKRDTKLLYLG